MNENYIPPEPPTPKLKLMKPPKNSNFLDEISEKKLCKENFKSRFLKNMSKLKKFLCGCFR